MLDYFTLKLICAGLCCLALFALSLQCTFQLIGRINA